MSSIRRALAVALLTTPVVADSWVQPTPTSRTSSDGRWNLDLVPGTCKACGPSHDAAHTGPHARVTLRGPGGVERSFELLHASRPVELHLADDGNLYTFDHWGQMGHGRCLARYDARGELRWTRTLEQLLPAERLAQVRPTVSSRAWLRSPLQVAAPEPEDQGALRVSLWNADLLRIERATGAARYEEVSDHGQDAMGWFLRAMALEARGELEQATADLHRAAALDLSRLSGYSRIAYRHHLAGRDDAAVALIEDALARCVDAVWAPPTPELPDPRRELRTQLAVAHLRAEQYADAEPILRALVAAHPRYEGPEAHLVSVLFHTGRVTEAEALVERGYRRRLDDVSRESDAGRRKVSAVMSAAWLCSNAGEHERAAAWYRRGIADGAWSEALAMSFVTVLEQRLDRPGEAAKVLARVVDDMRAARRAERDPERRAWWDRRLADFERRLERMRARAGG